MRQRVVQGLLLAAVVLVAYHDALSALFVLDDYHFILENPMLRVGHIPALFVSGYDSGGATFYRPLSEASFALDRAWFEHATGFHAVNVVWHLAATVALWALLRRLFLPSAAFWGALVFAVHPVHVEAVTGVVGRMELMAAAFSFACAAAWLDGRRALALVLALFALWSKESGVLAVPLAIACSYYRDRTWSGALFVVPLVVYGALRALALRSALLPAPEPLFHMVDAASARATVVGVLATDLRLLVWPHPLIADYGYASIDPAPSLLSGAPLCAIGVVFALLASSFALRRRAPFVALGVLVTLVALGPVSNLVVHINVLLAERFLYAPSAGVAVLVAGCVSIAPARVLRLGLGAIVGLCVILCMQRNLDWQTPLTLWKDTVEKQPRSGLAHANLALACETIGDRACAVAELRQAVAIEPFRADFADTLQTLEQASPTPGP